MHRTATAASLIAGDITTGYGHYVFCNQDKLVLMFDECLMCVSHNQYHPINVENVVHSSLGQSMSEPRWDNSWTFVVPPQGCRRLQQICFDFRNQPGRYQVSHGVCAALYCKSRAGATWLFRAVAMPHAASAIAAIALQNLA